MVPGRGPGVSDGHAVRSADRSPLAEVVRTTVADYGKVGLLVDDDRLAAIRWAREFYGAEELPRWWLAVHSCACATEAVRQVNIHLKANADVSAVVVVDRHLPVECEPSWKPRPKITVDSDVHDQARQLRSELEECQRLPSTFLLYHTSHQQSLLDVSVKTDGHSMPDWRDRTPHVARAFWKEIRQRRKDQLLLFGPTPASRRGQRWHAALRNIADGFERVPVVLFTGAGNSIAPHAYACGMPTTDELLEAACRLWLAQGRGRDARPVIAAMASPQSVCACSLPSKSERGPEVSSFEALCNLIAGGGHVRDVTYELFRLFENDDHSLEAFLTAMLRFDQGFSYLHWLLAGFRWSSIVTTNFDCFHERAAVHRLLSGAEGSRRYALDDLKRIKKPYGSLESPLSTRTSRKQIIAAKGELNEAFAKLAESPKGRLVILGHSLRDRNVQDALQVLQDREWTCWWIVPEAERGRGDQASSFMEALGDTSVPGRSLEFVYDLYWHRRNE